jgi:hypothetical protein
LVRVKPLAALKLRYAFYFDFRDLVRKDEKYLQLGSEMVITALLLWL